MKTLLCLALCVVLFATDNAFARGRLFGGGGGGCSTGGCSTGGGGGCNISGGSQGCNISGPVRQRASAAQLLQAPPAADVPTPPAVQQQPLPAAPKLESAKHAEEPAPAANVARLTASEERAAYAFGAPVRLPAVNSALPQLSPARVLAAK